MLTKTLLLILLTTSFGVACSQSDDEVLALVDSEPIVVRDLKKAYHTQRVFVGDAPETLTSQAEENRLKDYLLQALIDQHLLLLQARKRGLQIDAAALREHLSMMQQGYGAKKFETQLDRRGLTMRDWETAQQKKFLVQEWIRREVIEPIQINPEELKKYYRENREDFVSPEQVHALHIFVDSEEKAEELHQKIAAGADFKTVARENSLSPEAAEGGELGFFSREDYPPIFAEACFKLKKDELSPVIISDYGHHVFKVIDRKSKRKQSFTEAAPEIRGLLTEYKVRESIEAILAQLRTEMAIELYPDALKKVRL